MNLRIGLISLLATLLLVGAGCGGEDDQGSGSGGSAADAKALLERSFTKQTDAGELEVTARIELESDDAQLREPITLKLAGPFENRGKTSLPLLDFDFSASAAGQDFEGALKVTDDNAYVELLGQAFELGPQLVAQYSETLKQAGGEAPEGNQLKRFGIDPARWLKDPVIADGDEIGGDDTRVVSGSVDIATVLRDFSKAAGSSAFRKQLEAAGQSLPGSADLSDADIKKAEDAIEKLTFEVNVDGNDVVRRLKADVSFKSPGDDDRKIKGGDVEFAYTIVKVGGDLNVEPPRDPRPILELLGALGGLQSQ